jgi:hypothetical protein
MVRERRGRAKRSAGRTRTRGGDEGRERGRERRRKGVGNGKGREERLARRQKPDGAAGKPQTRSITWHSIFVARLALRVLLQISSSLLPAVLWCTLSLIQPATLSFPTVHLLSFPIGGEKFHDKKSVTCLSGYTAPHSCAACTGNSNTTSFPVNRR